MTTIGQMLGNPRKRQKQPCDSFKCLCAARARPSSATNCKRTLEHDKNIFVAGDNAKKQVETMRSAVASPRMAGNADFAGLAERRMKTTCL